jgi:hypothetical protein
MFRAVKHFNSFQKFYGRGMLKTCSRDLLIISSNISGKWIVIVRKTRPPWTIIVSVVEIYLQCFRAVWDMGHPRMSYHIYQVLKSNDEMVFLHESLNHKHVFLMDSPENLVKNFKNPFVSDVTRTIECWLTVSKFFWLISIIFVWLCIDELFNCLFCDHKNSLQIVLLYEM